MQGNFKELISGDTPVLINFYADWCAPCKMMPPILKEVKASLGDAVRIVKIDTEKNQQLAAMFSIRSIPTLMLFKKGNVIWKQSGVVPANQLTEIVRQHAEANA
jgi:thioredoxin 1